MLHKKEKIFIITFTVPYPPTDGGKIAIFSEIDYLRNFFYITVLFELPYQSDVENVNILKGLWDNVNIETINRFEVLEEKKKSLKKKSFWNSLKSIIKNVLGISVRKKEEINNAGSPPVSIENIARDIHFLDGAFIEKVENILLETYPIIIVEYSRYLSVVNILPKKAIKVFVEIESRFSIIRDLLNTQNKRDLYSNYIIEVCKNYEYAVMSQYDALITLTTEDKERINTVLPDKQIIVSPFPILKTNSNINPVDEWLPEKLVFLGSENHLPNKDAIEWFIFSILPLLNNTDIKLLITGTWSIETKTKYNNNSRIVFTGFVDDLSNLLKNSICVVPIRIGGGGIRSKVLESLAYGALTVSTKLGASGILDENNKSILIRNSEEEFAKAINWAIKNSVLAKKIIANGLEVIRSNYTAEITGEQKRLFFNDKIKDFYIRLE